MNVNIILNNNLNFNVLKKNKKPYKYIIIFSTHNFLKIILHQNSNIFFLKNLNYLVLKTNILKKTSSIEFTLNNLIKSLGDYFLKKIMFSGKGYKLKKSKKKSEKTNLLYFLFFFNKSHLNLFYFFSIFIDKLKKNKLLLKSVNLYNLNYIAKQIITIRKYNIYTLKGLRLSRQIIYKKVGKKSS